jgi:DNA-binding SARP family transcriptional activator
LDLRLETFGGLALVSDIRSAGAHQKRRLALLALLAASNERGLSRDQLVAYLWPEKPAEYGRHSLEQLLYALRQSLGAELFEGVDPVRLNDLVLTSDVGEFMRALTQGMLADACALYRGPFLDGFYLDNGSEFEQWAESTRTRLSLQHQSALRRLAEQATSAGNAAEAVRWWRALSAADPVSGRVAVGLMAALAAAGDRAAALQHARVHELIVREQLDTAPDEAVSAFASELRIARATSSKREPAAPDQLDNDRTVIVESEATIDARVAPMVGVGSRRVAVVAWAAIALAISLVVVSALARRGGGAPLDPSKVAIVPFRFSGPESQRYLEEAIVQLLAQELTGEGGPAAVDPGISISASHRIAASGGARSPDADIRAAREVGAAKLLGGTITWLPSGELSVSATLRSVEGGRPDAQATAQQPADSLPALVSQLAVQLLALDAGQAEQRFASLGSRSPPAVRAFLAGRAARVRGRSADAIDRFHQAIDFDSTFALAALDLALSTNRLLPLHACAETCRVYSILPGFQSAGSSEQLALFDRAVNLAWTYRDKLSARDRLLLDVVHGDSSSARDRLISIERALDAAPDRPETHYLLGALLLNQGLALGITDSRSRAARAFSRAIQIDSTYLAPLAGLVDHAFLEGDSAALRRLGALYLAHDSAGPEAHFVIWSVAVGTNDRAAHAAFRARFESLNDETLQRIWTASQTTGRALDDADRALAVLSRKASGQQEERRALFLGFQYALNRGHAGVAFDMLRRRREMDRTGFRDESYWLSALHAGLTDSAYSRHASDAARDWRRRLERDTLRGLPRDTAFIWTQRGVFLLANWDLLHGDTTRVRASIDWLRRHDPPQSVFLEAFFAAIAHLPGADSLLTRATELSRRGCCAGPWPGNNLVIARAFESMGRPDEALRAVQRGAWLFPPRYVAVYRREEGRLAAGTGDAAGAIRAWRQYLALRSDPDPQARPEVEHIRAELARLERRR